MERRRLEAAPSPRQAGVSLLNGAAIVSARSAWAVGYHGSVHPKTLILHWNGTTWKPG